MKILIRLFLLIFFYNQFYDTAAEVKLPRIFSSNMVLQQGIKIPVWGWAAKGENVKVSFNGSEVKTIAGKDGKWKVILPEQHYGGPYTLTITGKNRLVFDNVLIGEVWICSGQSNMQWQVNQSNNVEKEVASANFPNIRLFQVPRVVGQFPKDDIDGGQWDVCSPETVAGFSAVGYFFGRELNQKLNVPIGLIHTSWGGTVAETWSSAETISNDPDFKELLKELRQIDMNKYREEKTEQIKKLFNGELPSFDKGIVDGVPVFASIDLAEDNWKSLKTPQY